MLISLLIQMRRHIKRRKQRYYFFLTNMQTLISGQELCGLIVDYCDVFFQLFKL